jgi:hypothetical protein
MILGPIGMTRGQLIITGILTFQWAGIGGVGMADVITLITGIAGKTMTIVAAIITIRGMIPVTTATARGLRAPIRRAKPLLVVTVQPNELPPAAWPRPSVPVQP